MSFRGRPWSVLGALLLFLPLFASADADVEAKVRDYFAATPVMIPIAKCESGFRQFAKDDTPLYGGLGGTMIGVYQISTGVHKDFAASMGMDIATLEGNLAYAKYLYGKEGTGPWLSSFPCWNDGTSDATTSAPAGDASLSVNLSMGMVHPQILALQKILNGGGFAVAPDGPGSPGNETNKFGALTRVAVRKFQCAQGIACDGDEYSTGYGFVGAKTRAALLALPQAAVTTSASVPPAVPVAAASDTPPTAEAPASATTSDQQAEIVRLQAQITDLVKLLNQLLAARS